jgi:peptide/nickel transport system permease protein
MAQVSVTPSPGDFDIKIANSTLAWRTARIRRALKNAAWELWKNRMATVGAVMVLILIMVAILAPLIATHDPVKQNYREMLQGPSLEHYFGTDKFGRDIFRGWCGETQRMMTIAVLAVVMGTLFGVPLGVISGYYGGKLDAIIMRVADAWFAFPGILLFLLAATLIRAYELSVFWSTVGLIIALGVARTPSMARLVRGSMLAEREKDYVEASHATGESNMYIAFASSCPTACHR